jgi:hypothetical protein
MEKILLVINAHHPNMDSVDFACRIASVAQANLTGLFIEDIFFNYTPSQAYDGGSYFDTTKPAAKLVKTDTDQAVYLFKEECLRHGVTPEVYINKGQAMHEAIRESRFADLLIVDPAIGFYNRIELMPSQFVKEILAFAECPVLLAPHQFDDLDEIIFCFDNSPSSIFAIKQFTYLLPELRVKKVMLLEVNKSGKDEFDRDHIRMMEWLRKHYQTVYYHALKGDVNDELFSYLFMKRKKMIVMGAYGRPLLSNLFKKSSADKLIHMLDLPLFITHH